jgi:hypothetical protein
MRQGPMSISLHLGAFVALTVAAFLIVAPLGWAVIGVSLFILETLTRKDTP